jgi:hypothetical protein
MSVVFDAGVTDMPRAGAGYLPGGGSRVQALFKTIPYSDKQWEAVQIRHR